MEGTKTRANRLCRLILFAPLILLAWGCDQAIRVDAEEVLQPSISPSTTTVNASFNATIACLTGDSVIRYTLDGSAPTEISAIYASPIPISDDTTVKARAFKAGYQASSVATREYRFVWRTTSMDSTPDGRSDYASALSGTTLWVCGGMSGMTILNSAHALNLSTGDWTPIANVPAALFGASAAVTGGYLYVIGGMNGSYINVATLYRYNIGTNTWDTRAPMPTARSRAACAVVDGKIYVAGGAGGSFSAKLECYDPTLNSWEALTDMPLARQYSHIGSDGASLYMAGGYNSSQTNGVLDDAYAYSLASNTWTPSPPAVGCLPSLPGRRVSAAGVFHGGAFYVMGGADAMGDTAALYDTVFRYVPGQAAWETGFLMPSVTRLAGAFSLADRILVLSPTKILFYFPSKEE